ncbi:uncharacterized protein [Parasteatoda tepidariorum]|uniref:uncharacterized protein n=1 Tax=Parasteatoda tepidariorum TaxID=114398 RepID=UPI001C7193A7|nr:early endosome antigen 1-like [Parasteatoda tepidariorum]
MQKKMHVLRTQMKFNQMKTKFLQEQLEIKTRHFNDCSSKLSNLAKQKLEFEEDWRKSQETYEAKLKDLTIKLKEMHVLKHEMKNTIEVLIEENKALFLKHGEKIEVINDTRLKLNSLSKRLSSMDNQMRTMEKHLAMDQERILKDKSEIERLRKTTGELNSEITEQRVESELKATALKEAMVESEKVKEKKLNELYKNQIALRDEKLANLKQKLFESNRLHNTTKDELAKKSLHNSYLLEEVSILKKNIINLNAKSRQLRLQLKEAEESNNKLENEIESQKFKCNELIRDRNRFRNLYNKLTGIQSQHELEISILTKSQAMISNSLKLKEQQLNNILIKRRQKWIKHFRYDNY